VCADATLRGAVSAERFARLVVVVARRSLVSVPWRVSPSGLSVGAGCHSETVSDDG
jgi:hypothetical protein